MMKETPMLFSGAMVRAILAGIKTMTRRVVKLQEHACLTGDCAHNKQVECDLELAKDSPYGQAGDRLWVRETFCLGRNTFSPSAQEHAHKINRGGACQPVLYRANQYHNDSKHVWRPSIHMPRWACRITLEVTGVRVERLQSITSIDVQQEGIVASPPKHWYHASDGYEKFRNLWDKLNRKRKGGIYAWDKDPFVWVVAFRKL